VINSGGIRHLVLIDEGRYTYSLEIEGKMGDSDLEQWLRKWNTEELGSMMLSEKASYTEKNLTIQQKGLMINLLAKMRHAKLYAANYWENKVFDGIKIDRDD